MREQNWQFLFCLFYLHVILLSIFSFNAPELKATEVPFCNMTAKLLFWCFQSTSGRVFLWLAVSFDLLYFCVYHPSAFPYYAEGVVAVLSHQAGLGGRYVTIPSSVCNDCSSTGAGTFFWSCSGHVSNHLWLANDHQCMVLLTLVLSSFALTSCKGPIEKTNNLLL